MQTASNLFQLEAAERSNLPTALKKTLLRAINRETNKTPAKAAAVSFRKRKILLNLLIKRYLFS